MQSFLSGMKYMMRMVGRFIGQLESDAFVLEYFKDKNDFTI
jgi:hypothetical protein